MKKIEKEVIGAFLTGKNKRVGNTESRDNMLFLHGNMIAKTWEGEIYITLAGWNTATTRSRLNALMCLAKVKNHVTCKNFEPYLDGEPMDSSALYRVKW